MAVADGEVAGRSQDGCTTDAFLAKWGRQSDRFAGGLSRRRCDRMRGEPRAVQAEIVKAVADSNLCYRNSQVNVQLRLVHMEEVSYTPTGMLGTDLDTFKGPANDGHYG